MIQINQRMSGLQEFIHPTEVAIRIDKSNNHVRMLHVDNLIGLSNNDENLYEGIILHGEFGIFMRPLYCRCYTQRQLVKGNANEHAVYMVCSYSKKQKELTGVDAHVFLYHSFMKGGSLELYAAIKDNELIQIFYWTPLITKLMCRFANQYKLTINTQHENYR
jgi:hypothetical protein